MDPEQVTPAAGGGEPAQPTLNSTAGLSQSDLSAPPDPTGGSAAALAEGGAGTPGTAPAGATTAAEQAMSIRDAANYYGLDLSNYQDDAQAFAHLVQMARQAQQRNFYAELGQQVAPHAEAVQQYLREYQQRQQAAQPAKRQPWEAPEFDERWLQLVDRDQATGRYVPKPGVSPLLADKVNDYADHLDRWTSSLARNPMEALSPIIEQVATKLIETRFGAHQATLEAQQIIQGNEAWLYATDANGRRLLGPDGRYQPSPLGARYYTHLQTLQWAGVKDARTLDTLAKQLLSAEIAQGQAQAAAGQQQAAGAQAVQQLGRPQINPGQAVSPSRRPIVPGATDPDAEGLSLSEQMRRAMAEEGITDADFQQMFV
jgi:hypothetical protein